MILIVTDGTRSGTTAVDTDTDEVLEVVELSVDGSVYTIGVIDPTYEIPV